MKLVGKLSAVRSLVPADSEMSAPAPLGLMTNPARSKVPLKISAPDATEMFPASVAVPEGLLMLKWWKAVAPTTCAPVPVNTTAPPRLMFRVPPKTQSPPTERSEPPRCSVVFVRTVTLPATARFASSRNFPPLVSVRWPFTAAAVGSVAVPADLRKFSWL